jgi:hypothetical protein|tara:strand:- start:1662 stop:1865 length:204 start_codon:yes stop_codon:yes gene_type:complete
MKHYQYVKRDPNGKRRWIVRYRGDVIEEVYLVYDRSMHEDETMLTDQEYINLMEDYHENIHTRERTK